MKGYMTPRGGHVDIVTFIGTGPKQLRNQTNQEKSTWQNS
jgi:hypothetical protein